MQPKRCPLCQGDKLAHGTMFTAAGGSVWFQMGGLFKSVCVEGAACLACGAVIPYLDAQGLDKVRKWNAPKTEKK